MEADIISKQPCWYAVYTKTGEEDRAESNLRAGQIETFMPRVKARRIDKHTGKPTFIAKPLFERYLFARFKASETLHKVWFTRGVHSVVSFGEHPSPVDDEVIEFIQLQRGEDGLVRVGEELRAGDHVMINEGPLKNFVGVIQGKVKERDRISILLSAVNYQSRVVIERDAVKKIGCSNN